jgi:hypothetical protein
MLYFVLKACEFLAKKVSFLVEQAIRKNKNNSVNVYLKVLVFNGKRFYPLTANQRF